MNILLIMIGGFFGALSRYGIGRLVKKRNAPLFPFATLIVNLVGAFLLGCLVGSGIGSEWQSLIGTGFMGAFTTFSTLKFETVDLLEKRENWTAIAYLAANYVAGIF